jgi:hypothetical protein
MKTESTETITNARRLVPVNRWNDKHEWPPEGGLRHLIFHADKNGFNKAIVRCGRRVLIDEDAFFKWLDEQQGRA